MIDQFAYQILGPQLQPGETFMAMGHMRQLVGQSPLRFQEHIAAATDRRLFLIRTEVTGVGTFTVLPKNLGVTVRWFQDLETAAFGNVPQYSLGDMVALQLLGPTKVLTLSTYEGLGPQNEVFWIIRGSLGFRAQAQFFEQFGSWLAPQVEGRAFPLSPDRSQFHAQRRAMQEAAGARQQRHADASRKYTRRYAPFWLALIPLVGIAIGLVILVNASGNDRLEEDLSKQRAHQLEQSQESVALLKKGKMPSSEAALATCQPAERNPEMEKMGFVYVHDARSRSIQCSLEAAEDDLARWSAPNTEASGQSSSMRYEAFGILAGSSVLLAGILFWAARRARSMA